MAQPKFVRVDDAGKITTPGVVQQMTDIAKANGVPTGGTTGQVLQRSSTGAATWGNAPSGLPAGGSAGQAVVKQADGSAAWGTVTGAPGRGIKSIVSSTSDPTKATVTYTDNATEVITLPSGAAGKSIKSFGTPDPATGVSTVTFSDNTTTTITLPKGPKGDAGPAGKDGANWSKDQQAKAQGYWIVVSPTEPAKGTYTTADGTVVPVVWQKPIEVMVPVIPEAPYFDKYALSIQVSDLVGVDYYLTGFTKDGATVDVPHVKIPDGGILKLSNVSGKPALPYTVNVEARAEPGYRLPNALAWTYSVVDPNQTVMVTSDAFTGRTDGAAIVGTPTDASLGGSPLTWTKRWERSAGQAARIKVVGEKLTYALDGQFTGAQIQLEGVGVNQRVEFDATISSDIAWPAGTGSGFTFALAGGEAIFNMGTIYEGRINMGAGADSRSLTEISRLTPSGASGHYAVELLRDSISVSVPGMAPVTIPVARASAPEKTSFYIASPGYTGTNADSGMRGTVTIDNLKISKIGF